MYQTHHFKDKFILFLKIFFPILIYQFANYSASFVDTTMTGQYNTMDLAGVSMATSIWNFPNRDCVSLGAHHWSPSWSR